MKSKKVCKFRKTEVEEFSFIGMKKAAQISHKIEDYHAEDRNYSMKKQTNKEIVVSRKNHARKMANQKQLNEMFNELNEQDIEMFNELNPQNNKPQKVKRLLPNYIMRIM